MVGGVGVETKAMQSPKPMTFRLDDFAFLLAGYGLLDLGTNNGLLAVSAATLPAPTMLSLFLDPGRVHLLGNSLVEPLGW